MALDYGTNPTFAGRITVPDASYPQGSSKNESSPGANDGMPYNKQRADDVLGYQQALLLEANITPSGSADTALVSQYLDAAKIIYKSGRIDGFINGRFKLWQRGISFTASGDYTADRFRMGRGVAGMTVSQASNDDGGFAAKVQRDSGNTALNSMNYHYTFETQDTLDYRGKNIVVKIRAKAGANFSPATNTLSVVMQTTSADDVTFTKDTNQSISSSDPDFVETIKTIDLPASFSDFEVDLGLVSTLAKTINIRFFNTPVGTAGADDSFYLDAVQFEVGIIATDFELRPTAQELDKAQRYFIKGMRGRLETQIVGISSVGVMASYPTTMRTPPTILNVDTTGSINGTPLIGSTLVKQAEVFMIPSLSDTFTRILIAFDADAEL